jgi:hypothetical protein
VILSYGGFSNFVTGETTIGSRDEHWRTIYDLDQIAGREPTVPIFNESKSAETLLGCNFRRLAKRHHSVDHQIHRRLSFFKGFRLSDRSQVR